LKEKVVLYMRLGAGMFFFSFCETFFLRLSMSLSLSLDFMLSNLLTKACCFWSDFFR